MDKESREFLQALGLEADAFCSMSIADTRAAFSTLLASMPKSGHELGGVEEFLLDSSGSNVRIRMYRPASGLTILPSVIFIHGGAFVACDLDTHDWGCREICAQVECIVFSIDYRLAPEYKFPSGLDDCFSATVSILRDISSYGGDPNRVAIAGDSAGGNLATSVAQQLRDSGLPFKLCGQVLIYPCLGNPFSPSPSMLGFNDFISINDIKTWYELYSSHSDDYGNPLFNPLLSKDLTLLPPTLIVTAELDPLRDDAEIYAEALLAEGNIVELMRFDEAVHGFMLFAPILSQGRDGFEKVCAWLRSRFDVSM